MNAWLSFACVYMCAHTCAYMYIFNLYVMCVNSYIYTCVYVYNIFNEWYIEVPNHVVWINFF